MNPNPDEQTIRGLLENMDLKLILDSTENDYRFEYFTTKLKDRLTGEVRLSRSYRLHDLVRGQVTPDPWDTYELNKQTTLVTNLLSHGRYRLAKIICGWEVACPVCGNVIRGKSWELVPKTCATNSPRKCRAPIANEFVKELLIDIHKRSVTVKPSTQ